MTETDARPPAQENAQERAEQLKERVYVTFTSLAVILAMSSHAGELTAGGAATTLLITVAGTLLAVFLADLISHLAVHAVLPTAPEFRHMLRVSVGAIGVVVLPSVFLLIAGLGAWSLEGALRVSSITLVVTLAVIAYLAVRRVRMAWWVRILVLGAEVLLGSAVIALELLAHG